MWMPRRMAPEHTGAVTSTTTTRAAHIGGLAKFIRKSELYGLDLPRAVGGLPADHGMADWWTQLAYPAKDLN